METGADPGLEIRRILDDRPAHSYLGELMSDLKTKTAIATDPLPVWCNSCYIRIAPYDRRKAHQGKEYHSSCFTKINASSKSGNR